MAKIKPSRRKDKSKPGQKHSAASQAFNPEHAQALLDQATGKLQTGDAEQALEVTIKLQRLIPPDAPIYHLPVQELLGNIHIELGNPDAAREAFTAAAVLDPDAELPEEAGGGADKFLWLAQLNEEGGQESLHWFNKGITVLRREIGAGTPGQPHDRLVAHEDEEELLSIKRRKLADALCGAAEVYMTDCSWETDAEARCEALVTEACVVAPDAPEPLQTLASVRISQSRQDDARAALERSMKLWEALPEDHPDVPAFATRISLARLLMESSLTERALQVLERLISEDDTSVEAWYLGGWCQWIMAEDRKDDEECTRLRRSSRVWMRRCLSLFEALEYEDERLREHAVDLVAEVDKMLGPAAEDDDEVAWEDVDDGEASESDDEDVDEEDDDDKMDE